MASIVTGPFWKGQRARALAALLAGILLLGALAARTLEMAPAFAIALACALLGWAIWGDERPRWLAFVTLGLLLATGFVWSASERDELTIEVVEGRIVVNTRYARLEATAPGPTDGFVGVSIGSADDRHLAARWAYAYVPIVAELARWLNTGILSGLDRLELAAAAGEPRAPPSPLVWQPVDSSSPPVAEGPLTGWTLAERGPGEHELWSVLPYYGDYMLRTSIVRPGPTVRVSLAAASAGEGRLAIAFSPDFRTFEIERRDGQKAETLDGGMFDYRRPASAWLQALTRDLIRPALFGLTALSVAVALAGIGTRPTFVLSSAKDSAASTRAARQATGDRPLALLLALLALAPAALIATYVLEQIPHVQDSVTYLFQAQLFASGRFSAPSPPIPQFFEQEFLLVHDGKWFGKYSPGQPLVLALGVVAGVPWLVSPILGAGSVALTYLVGARLYGQATGWLAAVLLLLSPFFLFMSGTMMAHPAGLFWTCLALFATIICVQTPRSLGWAAAGFSASMLFITRPLTATVVLPLLAVLVARLARQPGRLPERTVLLAIGVAPPLLLMLAFNRALLGDAFRNPYELWWTFDRIGFGPGIGMHGPHDLEKGLGNTWANTMELMRHLYGWPGYLTLAAAMLPFLVLSRNRWDWVLGSCVVCLVVGYVFYWADGIMYGPRYFYEAIGMLALLSGRGIWMLAHPLALRRCGGTDAGYSLAPSPLPPTATTIIVATLVSVSLVAYFPPMLRAHEGYNGVSRARLDLVERTQVGRALVFVTQRWPDWQPYGSVFSSNTPLLDGEVIYARDLGEGENRRLMVHYPDRAPFLLRDMELTPISR